MLQTGNPAGAKARPLSLEAYSFLVPSKQRWNGSIGKRQSREQIHQNKRARRFKEAN